MTPEEIEALTVEEADELLRRAAMTPEERAAEDLLTEVGYKFQRRNPEYVPSPHAARLIDNFIAAMGWEPNVKNVERAFKFLRQEGTL